MGLIEAKKRILMNEPHLVTTTTAGIATFNTDMKASLKSCVVNFEPTQEGSGDPSPDNIRPITGWTGLNVYKGGKNLLNPSLKVYDNTFDIQKWGMSSSNVVDNSIILPKGSYTLSISNYESAPTEWKVTDSLGNVILHKYSSSNFNSFTLDKQTAIGIYMSINRSETNLQALHNYVMLEAGSTATNFEPYIAATTYPISWESTNGTLYGGYIDLANGLLVQTHGYFNLGDNSIFKWLYGGGNGTIWYGNIENNNIFKPVSSNSIVANMWCEGFIVRAYNTFSHNNNKDYSIGFDTMGAPRLRYNAYDSTFSGTNASLIEALDGIHIVMELKNPITYQLTSTQIKTLINTNNIWSNTNGDITTQYWKH